MDVVRSGRTRAGPRGSNAAETAPGLRIFQLAPMNRSTARHLGLALAAAALAVSCDGGGPAEPVEGRNPEPGFTLVGEGPVSGRFTSDLWVHGSHAYTGTWGQRGANRGNTLHVWDVSEPSDPVLVDSVRVDARTTNDVKVSADGSLGVVTHEGSGDGRNGITLLDLSDPAAPVVVTRYTTDLEGGVHNVWIEGDFLYVIQDGNAGDGRLRILDVSDPERPVEVADVTDPSAFPHDVLVRDGLAFLSFWDAGLVILDVGAGVRGGSPASPVEISRIALGGETHNAWYWPAGGIVFVGEEEFGPSGARAPGILHVVDVSDLSNPVEVATFETAENRSPPHNFWMDEGREILYMAWYAEGLLALDVSGTLDGRLEEQDRVLGRAAPHGLGGGCPAATGGGSCIWAPQLHDGLVFASDMNHGLLVFRPDF